MDTGPLLEFLAFDYCARTDRQWPDRGHQRHFLFTTSDRDALEGLFERHRGSLVTSCGVVGELQEHQKTAEYSIPANEGQKDFRRKFWDLTWHHFDHLGIQENFCGLLDIPRETILDVGLVDAGLIMLTSQLVGDESRPVLLTIDNRLKTRCGDRGIEARHAADAIDFFKRGR